MSRYMGSIFGGGSKKDPYDQEVYSDRGESVREGSAYSPGARDGAASSTGGTALGRKKKDDAYHSSRGSRTERPFSDNAYSERPASRALTGGKGGYTTDRTTSDRLTSKRTDYSEKQSYTQRDPTVTGGPTSQRGGYLGSFAPNPSFIRLLRFLLYLISSGAAFVTCVLAISVVAWYDQHEPSIKPSWGSLIALIVFGLITPGAMIVTFLITPRLFRYGTVLGIVNQVRIDLLLQFALVGIWVSAALAMASDLRGYENCIWDGYYYAPKPADFNHVCDLINATVIMAYVTFGVLCVQWVILTAIAVYILLYLDQEVLSELTNDMGGRAYRARTAALAAAGRASRPGTEFSKGAYSNPSEKGGYQSPRVPASVLSSERRMSRDYSEAEGGRGYGDSRRSIDDSGSERRRREDDVEGRSLEEDEEPRSREDEAYYGYDNDSRRGGGFGSRSRDEGPMMRDNNSRRDGPWAENMRDA